MQREEGGREEMEIDNQACYLYSAIVGFLHSEVLT